MNQTLEYLQELLAVPSPTGYTVGVQEYLMKTLDKLGYPYKRTPKGKYYRNGRREGQHE